MGMPEGFGDDRLVETITMSELLPRRVVRELRREAQVEQDWLYTGLEFLSHSLELDKGPKLFSKDDYETYERTKILTVPLGHVGIHLNAIFVAVNVETSFPERNDSREMRATAYKFDAAAKQICQYQEHTATLGKHDKSWRHDPDFGPYLYERDSLVSVNCWHEKSLQLPTETFDRISPEAIIKRDLARELVGVLGSLSLADQKNFSLFPSKL